MANLLPMDIDRALDFIRSNHRAVLATTRADGSPQLSPVAASVDDAGTVVISTRRRAAKTRNIERRAHATLLCFTDGFYGEWVQVEGPAEVVALPEAMDGLVAQYRSIAGDHPNWDEYRAAMVSEDRVLLRITVGRAGPDQSG